MLRGKYGAMGTLAAWLGLCCLGPVLSHAAPEPPMPRSYRDVQKALQDYDAVDARPLRVVLIADRKDHGEHEHDYPLWQKRWALLLGGTAASSERQVNLFGPPAGGTDSSAGTPRVEVICTQGWPDEGLFKSADVMVAFCYLKWDDDHRERLREYFARGGALVLIHSATWTMPGPSADVADLVGVGGFTRFRHGAVDLDVCDEAHPICRGLPPSIRFLDETYWPPTPPVDSNDITVLATGSEKTGKSADSPVAPQPMFWTYRPGRGRVFGCVLGHYTWTFDDPYFRILVLRGLAWAAGESPYRFDSLVLRGARVARE